MNTGKAEMSILLYLHATSVTIVLPVQLDLPGTPFNSARKARDYILAAIKERVTEKKLEFERGSVKKDTLLAFYASAKADEGDPLDEHELAVSCSPFRL